MRCSWLSTACELCVGSTDVSANISSLRTIVTFGCFASHDGAGGVGRDEDAPHPRREQVHRAQCVLELVDLPVAGLGVVALADDVALHALRALAHELVARSVDPREHHVDLEVHVARERGEHVLERRPVAPVQVHGVVDGLGAGQRAAHERVLDRGLDGVVAEAPELELHGGLAAVAEPPDGLDARTVEPQHGGLAVRGEPTVGEQHRRRRRRPRSGGQGRGVERLVRECVGEGAGHAPCDRHGRRRRSSRSSLPRTSRNAMPAASSASPTARRSSTIDSRGVMWPFRRAYCPLRRTRSSRSNRARRGADATSTSSAASASRIGGAGDGSRLANACPLWSWQVGRSIAVGTRHGRVASRGRVSVVRGCRDCSDCTQRDATLRPTRRPRIAAPASGRTRGGRILPKLDGRTCAAAYRADMTASEVA